MEDRKAKDSLIIRRRAERRIDPFTDIRVVSMGKIPRKSFRMSGTDVCVTCGDLTLLLSRKVKYN